MPLLTRPARNAAGRGGSDRAPAPPGRVRRGSVWVQLVLFGGFGVVFNVLYGVLYLTVLIPIRLYALVTPGILSWGTRRTLKNQPDPA